MSKLVLLRRSGQRAVYRAGAFSEVGSDFFKKIKWPEGLRGMIFLFAGDISGEQHILSRVPSKYWVTMCYSAEGKDLARFEKALPAGIREKVIGLPELLVVYANIQRAFYRKWRKYLGPGYLKECRQVASSMLQGARTVRLVKNDKTAAIMIVVKWKDCFDVPVDWVLLVWINRRLPAAERREIRGYFSDWMKKNLGSRVQCVINAFNLRSQIFFKKMGFKPECLHYVRSK